MSPFEFGQKTPLALVSTGEGEGDMTLWHILAPSLPGGTEEGKRRYANLTGNRTTLLLFNNKATVSYAAHLQIILQGT